VSGDGRAATSRVNARASTGPKTRDGKARVARNARRHGLSLPVLHDPALSRAVGDLARKIDPRRLAPGARVPSVADEYTDASGRHSRETGLMEQLRHSREVDGTRTGVCQVV